MAVTDCGTRRMSALKSFEVGGTNPFLVRLGSLAKCFMGCFTVFCSPPFLLPLSQYCCFWAFVLRVEASYVLRFSKLDAFVLWKLFIYCRIPR